jgi:predicted ribosome quality control (RQC) complex YloA/Tae2 family protein
MQVILHVQESIERNAERYFDKAKQAKKKRTGATKAQENSRLNKKKEEEQKPAHVKKSLERKRAWYEKFRWFLTSDGFLVIGGRDASTNEIIMKKHTEEQDLVLHTEMAGSPFIVIKSEGKVITDQAIDEAATFTASVSRAWKLKLGTAEVFYVKPSQVTKTARHGEYVQKGAFVISGDTPHKQPHIEYAIGVYEDTVMGGPPNAISLHCKEKFIVEQGDDEPSAIAKSLIKKLHAPVDAIIAALPSGGVRLPVRPKPF